MVITPMHFTVKERKLIMCRIDAFLVPLVLSWFGVIVATCSYYQEHKGLWALITLWIIVSLATIIYFVGRKLEKKSSKIIKKGDNSGSKG